MAEEKVNSGPEEINAAEPEVTEQAAVDTPPEPAAPEPEVTEPAEPAAGEPAVAEPEQESPVRLPRPRWTARSRTWQSLPPGSPLRWYLEKHKYSADKVKDNVVRSGVLYSSGLIAGEGIVGILLAVLAIIPIGVDEKGATLYVSSAIDFRSKFSIGQIGGLICFSVILLSIYLFAVKEQKKAN